MKWAEKDLEFLRQNYPKNIPLGNIAKNLNRTIKSIKHKASREEIRRKRFPYDKPSKKVPRKIIDKAYYEKNKEIISRRKMERRKKMKEELVELLGGKCKICGYNKCMSAFDFHHNKNKEANINTFLKNASRQKALKEVKKCILLCANCHRETHSKGP